MSIASGLRVLVGTAEGLHEFGARERSVFEGHELTALTGDGDSCWALVDGRIVWHSAKDGSWEEVGALEGDSGTCLAPTAGGLLAGTAGAHLLRLEDGRLVRVEEFDQVQGREEWYTPWGDPADTRSISVDPSGTIYVNVHVGGIVRSTDGGRSWQPTLDIEADVHQVLAHPGRPGVVIAAAGLGISEDRGDAWRFETDGLHAHYLRAVAVAGEHVLVSASTGHRGKLSALYRKRLLQDEGFERCRQGLPEWFESNIDTFCLAAAGRTVAFGTDKGIVFLSTDLGESWEAVAKDLPAVLCVRICG